MKNLFKLISLKKLFIIILLLSVFNNLFLLLSPPENVVHANIFNGVHGMEGYYLEPLMDVGNHSVNTQVKFSSHNSRCLNDIFEEYTDSGNNGYLIGTNLINVDAGSMKDQPVFGGNLVYGGNSGTGEGVPVQIAKWISQTGYGNGKTPDNNGTKQAAKINDPNTRLVFTFPGNAGSQKTFNGQLRDIYSHYATNADSKKANDIAKGVIADYNQALELAYQREFGNVADYDNNNFNKNELAVIMQDMANSANFDKAGSRSKIYDLNARYVWYPSKGSQPIDSNSGPHVSYNGNYYIHLFSVENSSQNKVDVILLYAQPKGYIPSYKIKNGKSVNPGNTYDVQLKDGKIGKDTDQRYISWKNIALQSVSTMLNSGKTTSDMDNQSGGNKISDSINLWFENFLTSIERLLNLSKISELIFNQAERGIFNHNKISTKSSILPDSMVTASNILMWAGIAIGTIFIVIALAFLLLKQSFNLAFLDDSMSNYMEFKHKLINIVIMAFGVFSESAIVGFLCTLNNLIVDALKQWSENSGSNWDIIDNLNFSGYSGGALNNIALIFVGFIIFGFTLYYNLFYLERMFNFLGLVFVMPIAFGYSAIFDGSRHFTSPGRLFSELCGVIFIQSAQALGISIFTLTFYQLAGQFKFILPIAILLIVAKLSRTILKIFGAQSSFTNNNSLQRSLLSAGTGAVSAGAAVVDSLTPHHPHHNNGGGSHNNYPENSPTDYSPHSTMAKNRSDLSAIADNKGGNDFNTNDVPKDNITKENNRADPKNKGAVVGAKNKSNESTVTDQFPNYGRGNQSSNNNSNSAKTINGGLEGKTIPSKFQKAKDALNNRRQQVKEGLAGGAINLKKGLNNLQSAGLEKFPNSAYTAYKHHFPNNAVNRVKDKAKREFPAIGKAAVGTGLALGSLVEAGYNAATGGNSQMMSRLARNFSNKNQAVRNGKTGAIPGQKDYLNSANVAPESKVSDDLSGSFYNDVDSNGDVEQFVDPEQTGLRNVFDNGDGTTTFRFDNKAISGTQTGEEIIATANSGQISDSQRKSGLVGAETTDNGLMSNITVDNASAGLGRVTTNLNSNTNGMLSFMRTTNAAGVSGQQLTRNPVSYALAGHGIQTVPNRSAFANRRISGNGHINPQQYHRFSNNGLSGYNQVTSQVAMRKQSALDSMNLNPQGNVLTAKVNKQALGTMSGSYQRSILDLANGNRGNNKNLISSKDNGDSYSFAMKYDPQTTHLQKAFTSNGAQHMIFTNSRNNGALGSEQEFNQFSNLLDLDKYQEQKESNFNDIANNTAVDEEDLENMPEFDDIVSRAGSALPEAGNLDQNIKNANEVQTYSNLGNINQIKHENE